MTVRRTAAWALLLLSLAVPVVLVLGLVVNTRLPVSKQGAGLDYCSPPFVRENPLADPAGKTICEPYENRRAALLVGAALAPAALLVAGNAFLAGAIRGRSTRS